MAQAIVRSLAVNAAKGQARAPELFTELLSSTESSNKRLYAEYFDTMLTYKIAWEKGRIENERDEPAPSPSLILTTLSST